MDKIELIKKITEIENKFPKDVANWTDYYSHCFFITTIQFVKVYIGTETEFYKVLNEYTSLNIKKTDNDRQYAARKVLQSIREYLELDLEIVNSSKYHLKIDIISDFLNQAIILISDKPGRNISFSGTHATDNNYFEHLIIFVHFIRKQD
jgi:hypothetical protein